MRLFSSAFSLVFLLYTVTVRAKPTSNLHSGTSDEGIRVLPRMPMPAMKAFQRGGVDMQSLPHLPLSAQATPSAPVPGPKRAGDSSIAATQEEGNAAPVNGNIGIHPGNVKDVKART